MVLTLRVPSALSLATLCPSYIPPPPCLLQAQEEGAFSGCLAPIRTSGSTSSLGKLRLSSTLQVRGRVGGGEREGQLQRIEP